MIPLDRTLVVTDTETTGIDPRRNRIIEIGATRLVDNGESVSFSKLIDPGESIPYRITRLTGITTAMVFGEPPAEIVMPEYFEFLGDGILVAHNLAFDRGFLNGERDRLGLGAMENSGICTLRLARRLLPGLRSKSLGSLARFFRIPSHGRHRALRDVEITAAVLERLMTIASEEHGVTDLQELLDMQTRTYARINPFSRHVLTIRSEVLPDLPEEPGVYQMLDGRGRVLYVGKAKMLSRRVRSYFSAIEAHPPRIRQLVGKLRDIRWIVTDTELEALLLEARLIQELDPPFNRAQKRSVARPYLRIGTDDPFPRVTSHTFPRDDKAEYYGPFNSRGEAQSIIEIIENFFSVRTCDDREFAGGKRCLRADIGRCPAPCEGIVEAIEYAHEIERIREFMAGDIEEILDRLESDMLAASEDLAFEQAAKSRDAYELIEGLRRKQGCIATRIFDDDAVIMHDDPSTDTRELLVIRCGVFAGSVRKYAPGDIDSRRRLANALEVFTDAGVKDIAAVRCGVNEIRVLRHWLSANRANTLRISRRKDEPTQETAARVEEEAKIFFDREITSMDDSR